MVKEQTSLVPPAIGIKTLPTESLAPNPHNPRMLFDRKPMRVLEESIRKVGILVPLTVYLDEKLKRYVILDGQRRWLCAKAIELSTVPVNQVAEPSLVQNIITMFQIHQLREDWELMPTALKLEVLMEELKEKNDSKLAELTGLDEAVVVRCKKLLSYSKKFQDLMLDADPDKRIKTDFFIELYAVRNDRFVNKMKWFSKDEFTDRMLAKYATKAGIKAVTDFRIIKQHVSNARNAGQERAIEKILKQFTFDDSMTLDDLVIRSASVSASARRLLGAARKLQGDLEELDPEDYYGEEELWSALEHLVTTIRSKLLAAGRRLKA